MSKSLLQLRGHELGPATAPATGSAVTVTRARRVQPGAAARDGGAAQAPVQVAPDELVRVEYENGIKLWMRADDLLRERGRVAAARGTAGEAVYEIDTAPRAGLNAETSGAASRGLLGLGIKVLEFFGVDVTATVAGKLASEVETRLLKGNAPGLYRCALAADKPLVPVPPATALPGRTPLLVFLHGTMSCFRGSYGDIEADAAGDAGTAAREARQTLRQTYGENIFAFEHLTLTQSPIANALALAKRLPADAELHLVSHSRGGLVGELLCLGERDRTSDPLATGMLEALFAEDRTLEQPLGLLPLPDDDRKARAAARAADLRDLRALLAELDAKRVRVRRFVRVACPARGTTLASGRLDRWLSVLDVVAGNGLFGDAADFLLGVLKQRTDPRTMPGVEAMMPGSALTRLLQLPGLVTSADLSVIAGDIEGDSLWGKLKWLVTDWFYGAEHDLVVNTGSMSGGIKRSGDNARWLMDRGPGVNHFRYFSNPGSLRWLINGLVRADGQPGGYSPFVEARTEEPRWRSAVAKSRSGEVPRPIVVVIPGTMGSELKVGDRRVWLSYWSLLRGGLADLGWDAADVQPADLLDDFYGPLLEHLAREHRVEVFPYDWRRSVRDSAQALAGLLARLLPEAERTGQPLHICAHSMGGLVARSMIADGGAGSAVWQRMGKLKAGSRLLMLGTPNRGSHEAVRWLTGFNPTQAKLTLLDLRHGVNGIIDIVRRYPGMAELLPFFDAPNPFGQRATYEQLRKNTGGGFPLIEQATLDAAATTWKLLRAAAPDPERMRYVAGCANATVIDFELAPETGEPGPRRIDWVATAEGDGTVAWASGRLDDVPMWYAEDTPHDELCSNAEDRHIFRGYVDLLATGRTDQLPTTPPQRARAVAGARFVLPVLPPCDDVPDEATLRSLSFSGARRRARRASTAVPLIEVTVRHADLAYARHAVLVGHYEGDTIVSAEAALDARLDGALSRRRDLGLYPGAHGTHAVFFNDDPGRSPSGAVVVGLGTVGELAAGRLQTSLRDAMLEFALRLVQRNGAETGGTTGGRVAARLSCLLVGSGGAGLSVRESVETMLRAAAGANQRLVATQLDAKVLFTGLEFIELFEDMAIAAAREVGALAAAGDLQAAIRFAPAEVTEGPGRRKRRYFDADVGWDQRIDIREEGDALRFAVATNRARADDVLATGQLKLADLFVRQASTTVTADRDVAGTLFELLLPPSFKASAPDQRDMVMIVDEGSARFPWELLEDRWSRNGLPLAIEAGMVRQFRTGADARPVQAVEQTALIIGNPDLEGDTSFSDLPGAREEAGAVRDLLRSHVPAADVADLIDAKAADIVAALHRRPWRVLHLAGHGEHEFRATPEAPPMSGMVIGRGTFLTPGDVAQMRSVPELVFINCCHLGKTGSAAGGRRFGELAANLGAQFIQHGVRAVVCAGWAVDDAAAKTFATRFYEALFAGRPFRSAVKLARRATWEQHPGVNTWGAYHCYGDPGWRLERGNGGWDGAVDPPYVSPREMLADLDNLAESARVQTSRERRSDEAVARAQRQAIERVLQRVPGAAREAWQGRADVAAGIGFAFAEARLFAEALQWLERALGARDGDCPVRAVEQAANLRVRLAAAKAATLPRGDTEALDAVAEEIEGTIRELDFINQRAVTPERLLLLGSACKRLAWVRRDRAPRVEALLNMAQYYRSSLDLRGGDDSQSMANWATACLLLQRLAPDLAAGDWHGALEELLARQRERNASRLATTPDFWAAAGQGDLNLVRVLMAAPDAAACRAWGAAAAEDYRDALSRGASLRELSSIREHLQFLDDLTADWPEAVGEAIAAVTAAL
ncbi:MAG: CHAT domain-containing protein [Rubrivivax sp.]|nr:CHAT domain-containing protein [Rubrivivax sp.]